MKISVISPVYKARAIIPVLVERIYNSIKSICNDFEIILVDDACPEGSWQAIELACAQYPQVKGLKLSRNFGQHYAITAGLDHVTGDWIVVMDCDLQDQPEEIPGLLAKALEGYDIVLAKRWNRQDSYIKRAYSKAFSRTLCYLTGCEQDETIANFGIYSIQVIKEIQKLRESIRCFPALVKWVGFRTAKVPVVHARRMEGKSSYNFKRMVNLALDIILASSEKPLHLTIKFGVVIALTSILMSGFTIIKWLAGDITVVGYASIISSIWFFSGCILITIGVVGLYVGKTFEGVKKRPLYIIEKVLNDNSLDIMQMPFESIHKPVNEKSYLKKIPSKLELATEE